MFSGQEMLSRLVIESLVPVVLVVTGPLYVYRQAMYCIHVSVSKIYSRSCNLVVSALLSANTYRFLVFCCHFSSNVAYAITKYGEVFTKNIHKLGMITYSNVINIINCYILLIYLSLSILHSGYGWSH